MAKIGNLKDFIEKVDEAKKINPKDLSSDQDLTIGVMNLISIEEHLMFSGAKTGKTSYYDLIQQVRDIRKNLMMKLIPTYEGEVWCISKHLLSASMRLMEVGTKQQSLNNTEEANKLFDKSYELYCLFWGLNMNMLNIKDVKWIEDTKKDIEAISDKVSESMNEDKIEEKQEKNENKSEGVMDKMKNFVKKAVNCCIE
ncbi:MAG: hypothetical protein IJ853_01215 [Rickettsiales bacterium]|nr:hypothetical protein [Rickettsiales bacterium]